MYFNRQASLYPRKVYITTPSNLWSFLLIILKILNAGVERANILLTGVFTKE
jgi:hypothetical protein